MPVILYGSVLGGNNWDIPLHTQKDNEWTTLKNARTWVRSIEKVGGFVQEFSTTLGITQPNMLQFWQSLNSVGVAQGYFVYAKGGFIRRISPAGDTDIAQGGIAYTNIITPASPVIPDGTEWNFTAMSGGYNMVVSNPLITPQFMNGDATALSDLPGWVNNSVVLNTVATTCQVIRSFKNQLIAGNITYRTSAGTIVQRPSTILISDKAAPGGIPQSWISTTANAADNFELNTTDPIFDIIILRDYALVLTANTMWLVGESTSQGPTPVKQISTTRGILGKGCVQVVDGKAFIVTTDDIIVADGSSTNFKSIANDIIKTTFFETELNINAGNSVFMRYHRYFNELIIAYPSKASGGIICDRALLYSLDDSSWSWTELPGIFDATYAPVVGAGATDPLRPWALNTYNNNVQRLHFAVANQLQAFDIGFSRNGQYQFLLEKFIDLRNVQGADEGSVKNFNRIYPLLVGSGQATVLMRFFDTPQNAPIDWTSPDITMTYNIDGVAPDYKLDPYSRGRYCALRIITSDTLRVQLCSFALDITLSGDFG